MSDMTPLYRAEMFYEKDGEAKWRPFPNEAGEWRRDRKLADVLVHIAKRDNPDVADAIRVARCFITEPQEANDE